MSLKELREEIERDIMGDRKIQGCIKPSLVLLINTLLDRQLSAFRQMVEGLPVVSLRFPDTSMSTFISKEDLLAKLNNEDGK